MRNPIPSCEMHEVAVGAQLWSLTNYSRYEDHGCSGGTTSIRRCRFILLTLIIAPSFHTRRLPLSGVKRAQFIGPYITTDENGDPTAIWHSYIHHPPSN